MLIKDKELFKIGDILKGKAFENLKETKRGIARKKDVAWDKKKRCFILSEDALARFRHVYPRFEIDVHKAEMWYWSNPKKANRKKANHAAFLVNWCNRYR